MSTPLENPIELGSLYRLTAFIGQGATGAVYSGVNKQTNTPIAAKILHSHHTQDSNIVTQFLQEKIVLTSLNHSAIVTVKDLVAEANTLAIITELVTGHSLRDYLKTHENLSSYHATLIATHVLAGLEHAHEKGITHRDIKPDNILLTHTWETGAPTSIKLTDFGIARLITNPTDTTTLTGTPVYMPPELWAQHVYNQAGDIYETGITLYEMLAGHPPFPAEDISYHHEQSSPPPLDIPTPLWRTLTAMLAKKPEHRPSATQAFTDLNNLLPELADLPPLPVATQAANYTPATIIKTHFAHHYKDDVTNEQEGEKNLDNVTVEESTSSTFTVPQLAPSNTTTQLHPTTHHTSRPPIKTQPELTAKTRKNAWQNNKVLHVAAAVIGAIALVATGIAIISYSSGANKNATPLNAEQHDTPLPSGLTISRHATWNPENDTITLTIEYATQKAQLSGPFIEIIENPDHSCAQVTWQETKQELNKPSQTHISAQCAWEITTPPIPPNSTHTVTASSASLDRALLP